MNETKALFLIQYFDKILGQVFDQGFEEATKNINTAYSTTRPKGKQLKSLKNGKNLKSYHPLNPLKPF